MKIHTTTLGTVEVSPESFLTLPDGLVGFEDHHDFVLLELSDYEPFSWLLSFSDPGLSFPLLDPENVIPGYRPELTGADRAALQLAADERPRFLAVATVTEEGEQVTINLRAPLAIHPRLQLARQVVLADARWEIQHPVWSRAGHWVPA